MSPRPNNASCGQAKCDQVEQVALHALGALTPEEARELQAHLTTCPVCREELESLHPVVESFASWPVDVLRPCATLWDRLAERIGVESGNAEIPRAPTPAERLPAEWEEVGPGISCKLLTMDTATARVSMLVRLAPGAAYPPHTHDGTEELHLLAGQLWINDRMLNPGDYNRAEAGSKDQRVWSATGCTCLLSTSLRDVLL